MPEPKPRSEAQIAASRANGTKSKGPITPEGKARSSRNALKHGLRTRTDSRFLSDDVVLSVEDKTLYDDLYDDYFDEHQPQTITQVGLLQTMVNCRWRVQRTWKYQQSALERDIDHQPKGLCIVEKCVQAIRTSPDTSCSAELLLRYEMSLDRQFHRALNKLLLLQGRITMTGRIVQPAAPPADRDPEPVELIDKVLCDEASEEEVVLHQRTWEVVDPASTPSLSTPFSPTLSPPTGDSVGIQG